MELKCGYERQNPDGTEFGGKMRRIQIDGTEK